MDKNYMELGTSPVKADDYFKNETVDAQTQEQAFLAEVASRSQADVGLVQTALELIKWCHGPKKRNSGEPFTCTP